MSTMIAEVYDALVSAGADDEKARAAATALADYGSRFDRIDTRLETLQVHVDGELQTLRTELQALKTHADTEFQTLRAYVDSEFRVINAKLALLQWLVGGVGFGVLLLIVRTFWPG